MGLGYARLGMMYVHELFMLPCRDSYYCEDGVYIRKCGMLRGRFQRKNSTHFLNVGTLHLMLHCG